jgi:hypothetical protein
MAQSGKRTVGFSQVLYVTNASTDQWFQPGGATSSGTRQNSEQMDNVNQGTMAERLAHCQVQVGCTDDANPSTTQIGKAVKPNTLADW